MNCRIVIEYDEMDTLTPKERHDTMSMIKGRDTKIEKTIRSALFKAGFRFRICDKRYPGKPDVVLPTIMPSSS